MADELAVSQRQVAEAGSQAPVNLNGRRFRAAAVSPSGQVDERTELLFEQEGDRVSARYSGGAVLLGFLVGSIKGEQLEFRYVQIDVEGETSSGQSRDRIELLPDQRVRLHERWRWESRPGSGESILEEVERD
jgi:hypothetical protein